MGWIGGEPHRVETEREVKEIWNNLLDYDIPARMHSCNSLTKLKGIFNSEKEAAATLNAINRKAPGLIYAEIHEGKESAKIKDTRELLAKEKVKLSQMLVSSSVYNAKTTKTVGCVKCGSSFPREYFLKNGRYLYPNDDFFMDDDLTVSGSKRYVNCCPICGASMRSDTAQKRIEGYRSNIEKYEARIKELLTEESKKKNGYKVYYVVMTEAYVG